MARREIAIDLADDEQMMDMPDEIFFSFFEAIRLSAFQVAPHDTIAIVDTMNTLLKLAVKDFGGDDGLLRSTVRTIMLTSLRDLANRAQDEVPEGQVMRIVGGGPEPPKIDFVSGIDSVEAYEELVRNDLTRVHTELMDEMKMQKMLRQHETREA